MEGEGLIFLSSSQSFTSDSLPSLMLLLILPLAAEKVLRKSEGCAVIGIVVLEWEVKGYFTIFFLI